MSGQPEAKSPHEAYYYYWGRHLQAVRSGDWKLHFPHGYRTLVAEGGKDGLPPVPIKRTDSIGTVQFEGRHRRVEKCRGVSSGCGFPFTGTCR